MFGPLAAMAQQALDEMRRSGVDPLVKEQARRELSGRAHARRLEPTWICGLDLGMVSDPTALAIARKTVEEQYDERTKRMRRTNRYAILHLQRWLGVDYPTIAEQLRPMLESLSPPPKLIADETGVGIGVVQILRRARLPISSLKGITITAGHRSVQRPDGGWNVPKKELVAAGQAALQSKRLDISPRLKDAKTLRKELQTFKVKVNIASMTESFEAWRESDHDDLVFAACLAVWAGDNTGQPLTADMFGFF